MIVQYKRPLHTLKFIWLFGFLFIVHACAPKPQVHVPPIEDKTIEQPDVQVTPQPEEPGVSLHDILTAEAEKFAASGNYQDALFVYNQAFSQADPEQQKGLIPLLEALLTQTPSFDIEQFLQISNLSIPKGLLQYWLAWNLVFEEDYETADLVLKDFFKVYQDHQYSDEARDLYKIVTQYLFKRDTIGCLLPLSGKYAIFGQQALAGIQLAIKVLSETHSTSFNLIIEDTQADPERAVEGVHRLYQKNVSAIIGPLLPVKEAGLQAEEYGIPMIALTQKQDFPESGDFLFSNFITPGMQVQTLGSYIFGELGIRKVAILYPDETYGRRYMNLFWDVVDEYNAHVVGVERYDGKKTDFTTALEKLTGKYYPLPEFLEPEEEIDLLEEGLQPPEPVKHARNKKAQEEPVEIQFEALFIPDSPSKIKLILPQLAFNDIRNVYLVGTNLWHHETLLKRDLRGYTRNAVIADGFFNKSTNPQTKVFSEQFTQLFDRDPKFIEAIAFDTASILLSTGLDETIASREELKDRLQGGQVYDGATGITLFDRNGQAHRRLFLVTIKKNQFVEINH